MKKFLLAIALALFLFGAAPVKAAEPESPWSVNLFCCSYHEDDKQRAKANQIHPGFGVRYDINKYLYLQGNYIDRNSVRGVTKTLGGGAHVEATRVFEKPVLLGAEANWIWYKRPQKNNALEGFLPLITGEVKITKELTLFTGVPPSKKKEERVWVFGINYRF